MRQLGTRRTVGKAPEDAVRRASLRATGSVLVALLVLLPAAASADAFTLPENGEVVRYQRVLGEIEHADPGPEVILYADGRVLVRRPEYMRGPGAWQARLAPAALEEIVGDLVASGLVDADVDALRARRHDLERLRAEAAARDGSAVIYAVGDPDRSVVTLRLAAYTPFGDLGGASLGPVERTWEWSDLYGDATRFPEIRELAALHRLELRLIGWIDAQDLEAVNQ
ncbi:MAG: hypothetical protein AAGC60_15785 [Acidobacteriota bacterium]